MSDKPPLTGKELQEKIRSGEIKVAPAPRDQTMALRPYIMRVLEAIGHPEAWVSDMSSIGDFRPVDFSRGIRGKTSEVIKAAPLPPQTPGKDSYQEYVDRISLKLAMRVEKGEGIVDIAMRLMAQEQKQDEQN